MLLDLCAGQDTGADVADLLHGWVAIVDFVCLPGVALFAAREETAVVNSVVWAV
jgi:hypothetical protein